MPENRKIRLLLEEGLPDGNAFHITETHNLSGRDDTYAVLSLHLPYEVETCNTKVILPLEQFSVKTLVAPLYWLLTILQSLKIKNEVVVCDSTTITVPSIIANMRHDKSI